MAIPMDASTAAVATAAASSAGSVVDAYAMVAAMLSESLWFIAGFALIRLGLSLGLLPKFRWGAGGLSFISSSGAHARIAGGLHESKQRRSALKGISASAAAGQHAAVLKIWREEKVHGGPLPVYALQAVAQALACLAPESLLDELLAYIGQHPAALSRPTTTRSLIDALLQADRPDLAEELLARAGGRLRLADDNHVHETLLGGFAAAGDSAKVDELKRNLCPAAPRRGTGDGGSAGGATPRAYSLAIKGFLKCGQQDLALQQVLEMRAAGLEVPQRAITETIRAAGTVGAEALRHSLKRLGDLPLPAECVVVALSACAQREDLETAQLVERLAREQRVTLTHGAYEPLLKLYAKVNGPRAAELFEDMQRQSGYASEGLCGGLLARCADVQNLPFAEAIAKYLRKRSMMTLATYKTLMKVYACCGLYGQACDLYHEVVAAGIEPDHVMYGCLVKFAVKCGRTDLSKEIFEKSEGGDIQNYMWLIRAAGREGNVKRALELLRRLEGKMAGGPDIAVYNCTLDVCLSNGDMKHAQELLGEIRAAGLQNLVTYNTLMKGFCSHGDLPRARQVIGEMEQAGHKPDSASFNCCLSSAVTSGSLAEAWDILGEMDRKGVPRDHYTVSIMMKAARKSRNPRDADRALAVLDRSGVNVCEDDVLFNTVLDACIHRRSTERLAMVLEAFSTSKIRPSVHTYGLLIKALGLLQQFSRCWDLWKEMVEQRSIVPHDITLSCMLDALICSGDVEGAVSLFEEWKEKVPPNTVIYSTLIKGFASVGDAKRAMSMYSQLRAQGLQMNLVAYTTLIDAHARVGDMEQAAATLKLMEEDGCQPNTITFSTLVKGYCMQGDLEAAISVFNMMLDRGLKSDTVMFNTMLDGCVRHSHFELADQMLADIAKYPVEPSNFTLSIIVKMWGKRQRLDNAFEAVRTSLRQRRIQVDAQVGTCLVSACLHNRAVDRALEAFQEIKSWPQGGGPDAGTYGALISGLARFGRCQKAVEITEEACDLMVGPRPSIKHLNANVVKSLFKDLHQHGLFSELGKPLANRLRAVGQAGVDGSGAAERPSKEGFARRAAALQRGGGRKERC